MHSLENLSYLVTATIFWWMVYSPVEWKRLPPVAVIVYLSTACIVCSVTGIVITFAHPGIYADSMHLMDNSGALSLARKNWGLTAESDQQLAGLLMWVPGCLGYLSGMLVTLGHWYLKRITPAPAFSGGTQQ